MSGIITVFAPALTATSIGANPSILMTALPKSETVMINTRFSPSVMFSNPTTTSEPRLDTVKLSVSFTYE